MSNKQLGNRSRLHLPMHYLLPIFEDPQGYDEPINRLGRCH
jgi:hypothetical protein